MYRIALVQNQSEMAHYGYADARPLIKSLGYAVDLYTADNVAGLGGALSEYDAVVLASNALNDKTIRAALCSESSSTNLRTALDGGLGLLCLHQLKLAQMASSEGLPFLPEPLNPAVPVVRPPGERSADGTIAGIGSSTQHITLLYPHRIDLQRLKAQALSFRSLPGLYWHYWSGLDLADWDPLLVDLDAERRPRTLLACTKQSAPYRIILSALTLDWQKQTGLLSNLLTYVAEGRHNTAILSAERRSSTAYEFLLSTLRSTKFPFRQYFLGQDLQILTENLTNGVHSFLLLGPFVATLPSTVQNTIDRLVDAGQLNLLTIQAQPGQAGRVSLAGRERFAIRVLQDLELRIQAELKTGSIDGSFWSTAETLQTLASMPHRTADYAQLVGPALDMAAGHDRAGSYDEVFGVTCAFYWLRARYRGPESPEATITRRWITDRIAAYDSREQVLAYTTFALAGTLTVAETKTLKDLLGCLAIESLSEIDLVTYLRGALAIADRDRLPEIARALEARQSGGIWIDLATSATAAAALIDTLDALRRGHPAYGELQPILERMIFSTVNVIQEQYERSRAGQPDDMYAWDGKASTAAKCLYAWLKFDELLDLPVYEVVEVLGRRDQRATALASGRRALAVLEELKTEGAQLRQEADALRPSRQRARVLERQQHRLMILSALLAYAFASTLVGVAEASGAGGVGAALLEGFPRNWPFHLSAAAILVALPVGAWLRSLWVERDSAQ